MKLEKINKTNVYNNNASKLLRCTCYCYCFLSKVTGYASQGVVTGLENAAEWNVGEFIFKAIISHS